MNLSVLGPLDFLRRPASEGRGIVRGSILPMSFRKNQQEEDNMKTPSELRALRAELVERRNVELYRLDVHNDARLARIADVQLSIQAVDDALREAAPGEPVRHSG